MDMASMIERLLDQSRIKESIESISRYATTGDSSGRVYTKIGVISPDIVKGKYLPNTLTLITNELYITPNVFVRIRKYGITIYDDLNKELVKYTYTKNIDDVDKYLKQFSELYDRLFRYFSNDSMKNMFMQMIINTLKEFIIEGV